MTLEATFNQANPLTELRKVQRVILQLMVKLLKLAWF